MPSEGSRNLALETSADWNNGLTSFNGQTNQSSVIYRIYNRGFKIGDRINTRIVLKYSDIVAVEGQTAGIALQCEGNVTHWDRGSFTSGGRFWFDGSNGEIELKDSVLVDDYILQNDYWNWRLRVDYIKSGHVMWKEAKAEISETATPYSQAPEDLGWTTDTLVPTQSQRYLWKFEYVYYSDGSVEVTKPVNLSIAGVDGIAGKDGVGLKSTLVVYGVSASETAQPTSWSTQVPTLTKGNYLWTKTTWTYTDNTTETGYQKTYIAKDGNNGKDGVAGKDGVGIKSTAFFYVSSTSGTTKPTTGWSTTIPSVSPGNYLWTKTTWTYTDNTTETGYSVAKMGDKGEDGRGEIRRETFYKLTNSNTIPTAPSEGGRNLLKHNQLINRGLTTFAYNGSTGIYDCIAPKNSDSWGYGFACADRFTAVPEGQTLIFSMEVNPDVDCSWNNDVNNTCVGLPSNPGGNDNDDVSKRKNSNRSLKKEMWNLVWFSYTAKTTTTGYTLYDSTSRFGIVTTNLTSDVHFQLRNIKVELAETTTPYSQAPEDLGWSTNTLVPTQSNRYLWMFEYIYYSDGSVRVTNPVNLSIAGATGPQGPKGDKGNDGIAGKDGVGLKSTLVVYGVSATETTQPSSWNTQVPTLTKGNYLWTKTTWTYTDNTTETGYQKTYIAKDGNNGKDGIAGKDGVGIKNTAFFYVASTSGTTRPTTGWSTTIPSVSPGNYLWTKTTWTYTDNTSESGYSVAKMGESQYTHFAYCNITKLCNESGSFTLQDRGTVRYGAEDRWIYKTLDAGTYTASNTFFGRDPYSGKTKQCELISNFSLTDATGRNWLGIYGDNNSEAVADPSYFTWQLTKGATGPQGIPGKAGADGKTLYFHIAYADSADGRTGFSFNESGQKYQGYYTDFTQSSSTDPTKYSWMDRRAGVEVGSNNLLRKTAVNAENLKLFGKTDTTVSVVEKDGHQVYKLVVSGSNNAGAYFTGNNDYYNLVKDRTYTFSFWVFTNKNKDYRMGCLGHIQTVNTNSDKVGNDAVHQHTAPVYSTNTVKANTWTKVWCTFKATSNSFFRPYFWYLAAGDEIYIYDMMLNEGNLPISYSLALEDIQDIIDSKADQELMQQQLNALAEQNAIAKAEMEAKASIDTVNQWITAYQNYVNANDEAKAESERNLQEASARILQLKTDVGTLRQQWDFIDTYMSVQNEGLIIGKSDGSAYAKFANDRISLFSGSSEVMYISQGVLRIENGIFTKTIQIGRFRFETHPADQDMLVLRYLGG